MNSILKKIAEENHITFQDFQSLSGGDINDAFLLQCKEGNFVVKANDANKFPKMFQAEAKGLKLLASSKSFRIPKVISFGFIENTSYLLLEHIATGNPQGTFWQQFAENLAALHKTSHEYFGLDHYNYIGSLQQYNPKEKSAPDFYINQRLEPQFKMAHDNGFKFSNLDSFHKNVASEIPNESPALVHGDLWGGNFLVSEKNKPVLIDPAVAFAPREMDVGMMHLFGGFSSEVFSMYNEIFPMEKGWKQRLPLWQLYYLLVHLNIFGAGYLGRVQAVTRQYS